MHETYDCIHRGGTATMLTCGKACGGIYSNRIDNIDLRDNSRMQAAEIWRNLNGEKTYTMY